MNNLITMGSEYGSWTILEHESLRNAIIISAGVGEDISFDVELCNKFNTKTILVDPTPRSLHYFHTFESYYGKPKKSKYSDCGYQPFESYDLLRITSKNFHLFPFALSNEKGSFPFFCPTNTKFVSHSLVAKEQNKNSKHITVKTVMYDEICDKLPNRPCLVKMDIEGSEENILSQIFNSPNRPLQLCVEMDFLRNYDKGALCSLKNILVSATQNNYSLIHKFNYNFLFCSNHLIN